MPPPIAKLTQVFDLAVTLTVTSRPVTS